MAQFQGQLAGGGIAAEDPTNPGIGLRTAPEVGIYDGTTASISGSKLGTQPITERAARNSGFVSEAYGQLDFYNRIHIEFTRIDLGNLIGTQTRQFNVFNAYFVPRTLNDITAVSDDGLILTEPSPTPFAFAPLAELAYELSISDDGPSTIAATYTFDFDVIDLFLDVVGTRLVLFPFEPDGEILETLEWKTNIIESYDGTEQRAQYRLSARQRLDYEVLTVGNSDTKLRGLLFDWLPRIFGVPIWFEMRRVTAAITAGATVVNVSTADADFRVDGLVMIWETEDLLEVIAASAVGGSSITLQSALENSYSANAYVMPVRTAHAMPSVNRTNTPTNVSRTSVAFLTLDNIDLSSTVGATLHDSKVLLDDANFMDASINEPFQRKVTVIDSASGTYAQISGVDRSRAALRKRWKAATMARVWQVRKLLHAFAGSRVSFFLPSFRADLILTQTIAASATTIRVRECGYTRFYKSRRPYGDLRILLTTGVAHVRKITGSTSDGTEEVISLAVAMPGTPITVAEVSRIELVSMVRLSNDVAKFTHERAGTATIEVNLTTCKE